MSEYYIKFNNIKDFVESPRGEKVSLEDFLDLQTSFGYGISTTQNKDSVKDIFVEELKTNIEEEEDPIKRHRLRQLRLEIKRSNTEKGPFYTYVSVENPAEAFLFDWLCTKGICSVVYEF